MESTLEDVVRRQRAGGVKCPCQNYTGLENCCCEPEPDPVEALAMEIFNQHTRTITWDEATDTFKDVLRRQAQGRLSGVAK